MNLCACPKASTRRVLAKQLLVMKLTLVLLLGLLLNAKGNGFSQTITWSAKNAPIEKVFPVIKKQTGYLVFYNEDLLENARPITINVKNEDLKTVLKLIFRDQPLDYFIENKTIVITKKVLSPETKVPEVTQPDTTREVRGTVHNERGEPLAGASVVITGTSTGSSADATGNFILRVPDSRNELTISFIGYNSLQVTLGASNRVTAVLQEAASSVYDIVVVGYGSVRKSDLTGAVSSISKKDIGDRQVSDLASLIQGRAAGVDVSQGTIRIRGITTFNNSDPLVVIDGFIGGNLSTVNPNDIENIEILKDASSTAIYGSRGANGVILVTTRSGKKGPMKLNLSYYEGISTVPKKLDLMNADQYTDYTLEILANSGITPTEKLLSGETRVDRTDWQDAIFRTSRNRELNADFSGGSENASYFVGMGYRHNENPTYRGMQDDNFYFRNKNTFTIKKWFRFGNNFAFSYNNFRGGGEYGNPGNLDHILNSPQYFPIKDEDGNYSRSNRTTDIVALQNPFATADNNHVQGNRINYQAALWAEVEPVKGLTYKIQAGVSGDFGRTQLSNDSYTGGIAGEATLPTRLRKFTSYGFAPLIEQYITYNNTMGRHDFSAMAGNTWQNGARNGSIGIFGEGLDLAIQNVLTAPTNVVTEDRIGKYAYLSYFGRINYQFADKYLATINVRTDGSPRFAPGNRWGTFPSVALAWKMHEEGFIRSLNVFDQLKFRIGWGKSGNDAIGDFRYLSQVYTLNVYYPFGNDGRRANGATVINNASSNIRWESTETRSVGLDMAFLSNRLSITADYYSKLTSDILYEVPQPVSLGYGDSGGSGSAVVNAASMENKGVELQVGWRSSVGEVTYSVNANYTYNHNKVTSLGDGSYLDGVNRTDIGNPVGYFYGFIADGIFMTQKEVDNANAAAQTKGFPEYQLGTTRAGDVRFVDVNGDGHVDNNDRTRLGSPHPTQMYGVNLSLGWKGFDFNVFLQGIAGSSIYDGNYHRVRGGIQVLNQSTYVLDRWRSESEPGNGIVPRAVIGDPAQNTRPSTLRLVSGNYTKIRQMSLGYSLPVATCRKIGFDKIRVYASAYNYFTFSSYRNYDPEVGGGNLSRGIDNGNTWPRPRMLMFGFQVNL